ncbi:DUF5723 family protein [Chitinophaga qingshengii]|uniref:DUF5723 domain-containing protein n=1 Tax=Chitinophaga qingshengii TaxID=1569794 RepID=A0ABR7TJC3_9BACT|nr:DUF5723 family protein [Chitinophaga qingshengii]MBC9929623.1 hypothetical protein [Chitinophaga qingshengii]
MQRILFSTILFLWTASTAIAQSFPGYNTSNYAGIYGVLSNPASAAGYRYKWDVNIIGADVKGGNTYVKVPKSILFHQPATNNWVRNQDYFLDTTANRRQNGWGMADIVMPSVLYAIDEKQSVSFVWRMRASASGGNLPTPLANFFGNDFPNMQYRGKSLTIEKVSASAHIWNELGLSYARVIHEGYNSRWKAGVTVKLLSGVAAGYAQVANTNFVLNNKRSADITSGTLRYAYNTELDHWQKPDNRNLQIFHNNGVGFDLGVIYEYRPDNGGFGKFEGTDADEYKFRVGVSLTDIGRIKYQKGANNMDLDLRKDNINPRDITYRDKESLKQYSTRLNRYFSPAHPNPTTDSDSSFVMALPATLNLMGDYNIDSRFFVSANAVIALNAGKNGLARTYALTQLLITPRYETELFGAYMPFVINHNGQADVGAGFRVGPLVVGSYSLFTTLFQHRINHTDAFVALRLNPSMLGHRKDKGQLGCPVNY